uniref:DBF4-CDC7 kinase regulatory subunit n=1 Tax=Fundulus heteroclitus TaxID=8078 RepID=A0A3Q2PRW2_FUNHE
NFNSSGKGVNVSKKTSRSQAQQKSSVSFLAQLKPLAGKVFYLDLQSNRTAETLESDIKLLGGTVEKFFSKEIKYLVSNKREAKHVHRLRQDSPVPSPDSGQSSPQPNLHSPSNRVDSVKSRSPGQVDKSVKSRGKSLVERVVKEQGRVQMDRILSNALEWGVKIFFLDDVLAYIQKKKEVFGNQVSAAASVKSQVRFKMSPVTSFAAGRIAKPFIKVEDSSRHYCPLYLTMPSLPEFNLTTAAPYSPFCVEEKASGVKQQGHRYVLSEMTYCDLPCLIFVQHLQSERHTAFSRSDEYSVVDRLVSSLHFNFLPLKTKANKEAVLSEAVQEAKVSSKTGNKLSEKEDEMPIFSRVQTIQRKIKVYKRKRRKVDPIVESAGPELENSVLKLWEIFQSSDDMDVEFRGFAD